MATHYNEVTYRVTMYDGPTTRIKEVLVKGIDVDYTDHEEHPMFYIISASRQTAFTAPVSHLISIEEISSIKKPRPSRTKKKIDQKVSHLTRVK